ncbi:MAG TPA: hypothetical protein VE338_18685 [Ktedonobacterales bacterium]|jgi:DNA-binding NtrC family response regulator|nr:hypothetical protein [Ktedonobacterales bacterium]
MNEADTPAASAPDTGRRALLLDPDLFFSVKVSATLKHMAITTTTVRQAGEWTRRLAAERFDIGLVNTAAPAKDWREAIASARAAGLPIIAYGSHVDIETQAQARAAGATRVIANSKLAADLPAIVEQTLQRARRTDDKAEAAEQDTPRSDDV